METREMSAKTVEEAIELALKELGAEREEVEIEILDRGKAGFLGIGAEPARVRVRRVGPGGSAASRAMTVVTKLLSLTRASALSTLRSAHDPESGGPVIDIQGMDSGLLIGRRGETLRALQLLTNLITNRDQENPVRTVLDIEQYRQRRDQALKEMALRVAERVAATSRPVTLEPMSSAERRIVHLALSDHPRVITRSVGFGDTRKVSIVPKEESPPGSWSPAREESSGEQ
ncbi:MAG: RNA-binding cell elongation regulator Jag/EloR [Dehalococcoidia bacterium]